MELHVSTVHSDLGFHQRRSAAVLLVFLSGIAIFCLSLALQVLAWELRLVLHARFGWDERSLPLWTAIFVDRFGYRPDSYLTLVTWWFWWPMVGSLGYCHIRYTESRDFAIAFMFSFVLCWLLFAVFVSVILLICSMPFVILLAELHESPRTALLIVPLSWAIPACTAAIVLVTWWRRKKSSRSVQHTRRCPSPPQGDQDEVP